MTRDMKMRWIALLVENQVGVLAKVSGLLAGKSYNMQSLTVGTTEHEDVSRMTISVLADDVTFEQIKKQFNSMVEVIKVMYVTLVKLSPQDMQSAFQIARVFKVDINDIGEDSLILECLLTEKSNNELIALLKSKFRGRLHVVRGGAVACESISHSHRV